MKLNNEYIYYFGDYIARLSPTKNDKNGNKKYILEYYKSDFIGFYIVYKVSVFEHNTSYNEVKRMLQLLMDTKKIK